ncbi:hypothetical protein FRC01_009562 [Tulasnella sp. 417]|nr:hypothetical protein FRC01_009562 [Tulasnella sp. 417]
MLNAEDQLQDDDDPQDHRPRGWKDSGKDETMNKDVHTRIRSLYGLGNDETRISSADVILVSPAAEATTTPPPSSSRYPVTPSMSRTNSHASGSAGASAIAAVSALEKDRKDDTSDAASDVGSGEELMSETYGGRTWR